MTKMYIDYAVVKQALEFVTSEAWGTTPYMDGRVYEDAARLRDVLQAALRAAPAQQDEPVEPVAEVFVRRDGVSFAFWLKAPPPERTKLYTAPPQRKPLTEEKIDNICRQAHGGADPQEWARNFARAIERAHGIKE